MSTREFKPAPETSIPGGITDIDLSATLADGSGYPTGAGTQSFALILDPETSAEEHVLCSGRSGDVVTFSIRGYAGTAAVDHDPGCRVRHGFDSVAAQDVHDHLDDPTAAHPASSITYTPVGTIAATDVQSAVAEVASDAAAALTAGLAGVSTMPIGSITMWPTATAPTGWLLCDGAAVSRTTYSALFALLSSLSYGSGNGTTTFNVPNLKGKIPVGLNSADTEFDTLAETGGEKEHTLTLAEGFNHNHTLQGAADPISGSSQRSPYFILNDSAGVLTGANGIPATPMSPPVGGGIGGAGGGSPHNNIQPYIVLNYVIKAL